MSTAEQQHYNREDPEDGNETPVEEMGNLVSTAEINQQIATAKRFPRSIENFIKDAERLVSLNINVASQCTYALKRSGKTIEGPSARFAEIINSCYGNVRSAARVVDIGDEYITAEGICYDLQKNNAIRYEVIRRITDKDGNRYNSDMIGVTGNAACSIAIRNAILKVIPKAFWQDIWEKAKDVARGDEKTFGERRNNVIETFKKMGVTPQQIYTSLGISGLNDMTRDHMVTLAAILTAIKDGDTTVEQEFGGGERHHQGGAGSGGGKNEFTRPQQTQGAGQPQQVIEHKPQEQQQTQTKATVQQQTAAAGEAPPPTEQKTETKEVSADDRAKDVMKDYLAQKTQELNTMCKRVRDVLDLLAMVKDEFGEDHWVTRDFEKLCEVKQNELLAGQATKARKGK